MSWRVTPSQCGTLRRCRGEMQFLNPSSGTPKRCRIQAPTPPAPPLGPGALRLHPAAIPAPRARARAQQAEASLEPRTRAEWTWLDILLQKCTPSLTPKRENRPIPLDLVMHVSQQRRLTGKRARWRPGAPRPRGTARTKAQPSAPAPRLPFQFSPDLRWN